MMKMIMRSTDDYEKLVKFFVINELEFDGDEEVDTDIVKCYEIVHGEDEYLAGAVVLAKREGKFIIDGIAVDKLYRKTGIGKIMLDKIIEEVKSRQGHEIYLVARAPEFFRKNGFETVNPEGAPNFFECKQCPQYNITCHPEVMRLKLD